MHQRPVARAPLEEHSVRIHEQGDTPITPLKKDWLPVSRVPFSPFFLFFARIHVLLSLSCHHQIHHTAAAASASDAVIHCLTDHCSSVLLHPRPERRTQKNDGIEQRRGEGASRTESFPGPRLTPLALAHEGALLHSVLALCNLFPTAPWRLRRQTGKGPLPFL